MSILTRELKVEEPKEKSSNDVNFEVNDEISFISSKTHHVWKKKEEILEEERFNKNRRSKIRKHKSFPTSIRSLNTLGMNL